MKSYLKLGRYTDLTGFWDRTIYRFFEMLPALLSWTTLFIVVAFSFWFPTVMALFIIVFDIYWLVKTIYMTTHMRTGFRQVKINMAIDWLERLEALPSSDYTLPIKNWREMYHLIFLPTYKEDTDIIDSTLDALLAVNYPKDRLMIVLAQEARAGQEFNTKIRDHITHKYGQLFGHLIITEHPTDIEGEIAGKGSNTAYAGHWVKEHIIDPQQIPYHNILVSVFDIDTIVFSEYFGRLTYVFLQTPNPLRHSYQPVPFYINNIWEAPALARLVAFSTTLWQTVKQEQAESMITYSSHSMPWQAVVDVDFWQTNVISEDSRIFWQCLLAYDGEYYVAPLYYPVSMDANVAPTFWRTMINVYKQHRRWGYGIENTPYFVYGFIKNKQIALSRRLRYSFTLIEGNWSWATNALILFMLGWLPIVVGGAAFNVTVLSFNLPYFTRIISILAMVGLITSATISIFILPPRPPQYGKFKHFMMIAQWILFPITSIVFGAIPALDAQTRMLFARYMGFWVTPKTRSTPAIQAAKTHRHQG